MLNRDNTSKLLQLFFLTELAKRVPSSLSVISAVTPGFVYGTKSDIDFDDTFKGYVELSDCQTYLWLFSRRRCPPVDVRGCQAWTWNTWTVFLYPKVEAVSISFLSTKVVKPMYS